MTRMLTAIGSVLVLALPCYSQPQGNVERRTLHQQFTLQGQVVPSAANAADVHAPYAGATVHKVFVTEGQAVQRGEVLVVLLQAETKARYDQAQQTLLAARDSYGSARDRYAARIEGYRSRYDSARQLELQAREAVRASEARRRTQAGQSVVDPQTGRRVQLGPDATLNRLVARDRQELSKAQQRRLRAQRELANARSSLWADVQRYEKNLRNARAEFARAEAARKEAQVYSPVAGQVTEVLVKPGERVLHPRAFPMVRVANLSELVVEAPVPEYLVGLLEAGTSVELEFQDRTKSTGKIIGTQGLLDSGGAGVRVDFYNPAGAVKPWMTAEVLVQLPRPQALVVPEKALLTESAGTSAVLVQTPEGGWSRVPVQRGYSDGSWVEVHSHELRAGQVVGLEEE